MYKLQLHFLKNTENDSYKFWQNVTLNKMPKLHSIFEYTMQMYDEMSNDEKDTFENLNSFAVGNYYIKTIMDRTESPGEIDYIIELVFNIN